MIIFEREDIAISNPCFENETEEWGKEIIEISIISMFDGHCTHKIICSEYFQIDMKIDDHGAFSYPCYTAILKVTKYEDHYHLYVETPEMFMNIKSRQVDILNLDN